MKTIRFILLTLGVLFGFSESKGQKLYAVSGASGNPSYLYELNPATGDTIRTIGYTGYSHITGIAVHPKTGVIYGHVNGSGGWGNGLLVRINKNTGSACPIGTTGIQSPDLAFDTAGTLYAWYEYNVATNHYDDLGTIDLSTGAFTEISSNYHGTWQTGIAFNSHNQCYMKEGFSIYPFNHTVTSKGSGVFFGGGTNNLLAFDDNDVCYTGQRSGSNFILKTIDVNTGNLTTIGTAPVPHISAIAFDNNSTSSIPPTVSVSITQPTSGQSNGSISTTVCGNEDGIRYSRWAKKGGVNYPESNELNLSNANAGDYMLMLITNDNNIHYYGPYTLN